MDTDTGGGIYRRYMGERQQERSYYIGPSGVDSCYRQHAFRYMEIEPTDVVPVGAADFGTLLHLGWSALIKSQFIPTIRDADVVIDWGGPRTGSADDVDYVNKVVSDVKSTSDKTLGYWLNNGVSESYWTQLTCYAKGLQEKHGGDWEMRIIAIPVDGENRGVPVEFVKPYDPARGAELVSKANERHRALRGASQLLGAVHSQALGMVENFPREGRGPGSFPCDWCQFKSACWPEARDGLSPQSETVVDDPAAVGGWAAEYLEAAAEESAARRRKGDAANFLRGIAGTFPMPDGTSAKVVVVGGKPKSVVDMDEVKVLLGSNLPMKEQVSSSYPRVTRVK